MHNAGSAEVDLRFAPGGGPAFWVGAGPTYGRVATSALATGPYNTPFELRCQERRLAQKVGVLRQQAAEETVLIKVSQEFADEEQRINHR